MTLENNKKIYFASDIHLGLHPYEKSRLREKRFVKWLDEIKKDAARVYLLGDLFDYWFEYKKVVPRGFVRTLGKIAELTDSGIDVHLFTGNHDVWIFDYLPQELGITLHRKPFITEINGKVFYLAHGDGLGPGDWSYKFLKSIFENKVLQWLFARLHPNFSIALAHAWSKKSRLMKGVYVDFQGEEKELQILHAKNILKEQRIDYFVFGHRHIPIDFQLDSNSRLINLGEWIVKCTYAVFDGKNLELKSYATD